MIKIFDNIPRELQELKQWVCAVEGSKVPLNPITGKAARCSDPDTWGTFAEARAGVEEDDADNIGFVFHGNGIVGVDLDEGVWDEYGLMTPLCVEFLTRFNSYAERSRSGRGLHIIVKGKLPWKGRNNRNGVEAYEDGRYFIMTGKKLTDHPVIENQSAIDWMVQEFFPELKASGNSSYGRRVYETLWKRPKRGAFPLYPEYPTIGDGSRNLSLASVAGSMHTVGYTPEAIRKELAYVNRIACDPPLDRWEIEQIVRSVTRYKR